MKVTGEVAVYRREAMMHLDRARRAEGVIAKVPDLLIALEVEMQDTAPTLMARAAVGMLFQGAHGIHARMRLALAKAVADAEANDTGR